MPDTFFLVGSWLWPEDFGFCRTLALIDSTFFLVGSWLRPEDFGFGRTLPYSTVPPWLQCFARCHQSKTDPWNMGFRIPILYDKIILLFTPQSKKETTWAVEPTLLSVLFYLIDNLTTIGTFTLLYYHYLVKYCMISVEKWLIVVQRNKE